MIYCFCSNTSIVMTICQCLVMVASFHTTVVAADLLCSCITLSTVCLNTWSYHSSLYQTCSEQMGFSPTDFIYFSPSKNVAWIILLIMVTVQGKTSHFLTFISPPKFYAMVIYSNHFGISCIVHFLVSIKDKIIIFHDLFLSCIYFYKLHPI